MPTLPTSGSLVHKVEGGAQYNTGTTQATDGQTVATLVDTGGSTNNVLQGTSSIAPTFKNAPTAMDNKLLRFVLRGTNRPLMTLGASTPSDRANMTIFLVHRTVYHVSNQQMPIGPGAGALHGSSYWDQGAAYSHVAGANNITTDMLTPGCDKSVLAVRCDSGGIATIWRNLRKSTNTTTIGTGTSTGGFLSCFAGSTWQCAQDIWDVRMYAAVYTDTQMKQYIQQLMYENKISPPCGRIVFDGDSIMAGHSIGSASVWTTENDVIPTQVTGRLRNRGLQFETWNVAIASQTVSSLVTNFPSYVTPRKTNETALANFNYYVVLIGTNDVSNGKSATDVYNAIRSYCLSAKASGFRVVVSTLLYKYAESAALNTVRDNVNALIRSNYTSFADRLADIADYTTYPQLLNSDANSSRATYFETSTNIHPTSAGGAIAAIEYDKQIAADYAAATGSSRLSTIAVATGGGGVGLGSLASGWYDAIAQGGYGIDASLIATPGTQISRLTSRIIRRPAGSGNTLVFRERRPVGITSVDQEPGFVLYGRRSGSGDVFEPLKNGAGNAAIVCTRDFTNDVQDDAGAYQYSVPSSASKVYIGGYDEFLVGQTQTAVANGTDTSLCSLQVRLSETYPTA